MQTSETTNLFDDEVLNKVYQTREAWAKNDSLRDEGITPPDGVTKIIDIPYEESQTDKEAVWHTLDIYYPKDQKENYPVIVSVHGGGWFYGSKELYRPYCMHLASKGFAVVNFNYRRGPEYRYPGAFLDVCAVMDFVLKNAEKYHFDLNKIFMVGDSAGAQLASQYCIYATSDAYRELFNEAAGNAIGQTVDYDILLPKGVALNCGVYNMKDRLEDEVIKWYLPTDISGKLLQSFSDILQYMNDQFPPTYLMLSVNDDLKDQSAPMRDLLMALRIKLSYHEMGQDNPQDGHVFHLNMRSINGQQCNQEECDFFLGL